MEISSLESLVSGNSTLQFKSVELTPRREGKLPVIKGRGHVVVRSDGEFNFEVELDEDCKIKPPLGKVFEVMHPKFGSFFEEDELYDFRGEDFCGISWVSEKVVVQDALTVPLCFLPKIDFVSRRLLANTIIDANENRLIITASTSHGQNWSRLLNVCLPICIEQGAVISVTFGILNDIVTIECVSDTQIYDGFEDRIIAGLSFVMDETLDPRATYRQNNRSFRVALFGGHKQAEDAMPIVAFHPEHRDYHSIVCEMLKRYIDFENKYVGLDHGEYHPVDYLLRLLRRSSNSPLDANILTACVVAEGLLDVFESSGSDELNKTGNKENNVNEQAKLARNEVFDFIDSLSYDDAVKRQLSGALKRVGTPREVDVFHRLGSTGRISKENYEAWKELRHRYVHMKRSALANKQNVRARYMDYLRVVHLIRQTVLALIGYNGFYTAYGDGEYRAQVPIE